MKATNLTYRFATAFAVVPILILAINWSDPYGVYGLVTLATLLALLEYFSIFFDDPRERVFGVGLGMVLSQVLYWWVRSGYLVVLPAAVLGPALYLLFRFRALETVGRRMGLMSFG